MKKTERYLKEHRTMSMKKYCTKYGKDENRVFEMILSEGGGILACPSSFTGYAMEIGEESFTCVNDQLNVCREFAFSDVTKAEFDIEGGNLFLRFVVEGRPLVFCSPRKSWKEPAAKLLLERISEKTEIGNQKLYDGYTGKLFWLYLFK
ncbi:MAG: hypothetical protein J6M12_02905 [Clostridia bacterium]|nr:hypothetical protein [Clostridia bacterium]